MKLKIKIKDVFIYVFIIAAELMIFDVIIRPSVYFDMKLLSEKYAKFHHSQKVAPSRLYVNVWRETKLRYADKTMNNQEWNVWRNRYAGKIHTLEDAEVAINTMLASLNDPYTQFLSKNKYSKQSGVMESVITGTGLVFNKTSEGIVVNTVLKNSSAKENKVMTGDKIVKINGVDVKNLSVSQVQNILDKSSGNDVKITFKRGEKISEKSLKKTEIPINTMSYTITDDNIGIVRLSNIMGKNALKDFKQIIKATNNTKALVLDLRNNYGGLLTNAVQMADLMLTEKKIVDIKSREKIKYEIYSGNRNIFKEKPVIILVNEKTASAAEIFAGALKSNLETYLIGENTFGKNTIQYVVPMSNETGIIITSDKYILPGGEDIDGTGIKPDIELQGITEKDYGAEVQKILKNIMKKNK